MTELARDEQDCMRGEPFLPVLERMLAVSTSRPRRSRCTPQRGRTSLPTLRCSSWRTGCGRRSRRPPGHEPEPGARGVHAARAGVRRALRHAVLLLRARASRNPNAATSSGSSPTVGASPDAVLFVDDSARNVVGAREVGLSAEQWHLDDGLSVLRDLLAVHGWTDIPSTSRLPLDRLAAMTSYIAHTTVDCPTPTSSRSGGRTCSATSTSRTTPTSPGTPSA